MYHGFGGEAEGGSNLLIDGIHEPGGGVPARMAPLVLVATVVTHLFGGSAGREGTAVQMGGSIASTLARPLGLGAGELRALLMAGIAAGFGAVFGTPIAGAVFAVEVLVIGRIESASLFPVLVASFVGDATTAAWGIGHTEYRIDALTPGPLAYAQPVLLAKVAGAAIAFGLASVVFAKMTHGLTRVFKRCIAHRAFRPFVGGSIVIALVHLLGTREHLGLGVHPPRDGDASIVSAFHAGGVAPWSWWWKIVFTAVTIGSGFKGGEVTPLFFVGATLGNALAGPLGVPADLLAGIGLVAVFAGATNTPLACTLMGIELFGAEHAAYFAVACFVAFLFSGRSGIYQSRRVGRKAGRRGVPPHTTLREIREARRANRTAATHKPG
jgi:H+/Cl- antiporter ClcA